MDSKFDSVDVDKIRIPNNPEYVYADSIYQFGVKNLKGDYVKLDIFKGHVCIIVNIASQSGISCCQVRQFNELYENYGGNEGLRILAFPCNQFGNEEPGTSDDIATFVKERNIKFDIFEKVDVNGDTASDLWKFLKFKITDPESKNIIKWSYTKFIIDKNGVPVERYGSKVEPLGLIKALQRYW